jgi:hypothetical protein
MKKSFIIIPLIIAGLIFLTYCEPGPETGSFQITFEPYPPVDLDSNATEDELISFAWNEFFALNWQSSFSKDGKRDNPDTTWSYESDPRPFPDTVVWETYAHRTELRPADNVLQPFDNPPHYSFGLKFAQPDPQTRFDLFNNLDENNEIGSCFVYGQTDAYDTTYKVLYQAKANRDEYQYLFDNYRDPQTGALEANLTRATQNTAALLSDSAGANNNYAAYYSTGAPCNPQDPRTILCLPCGDASKRNPSNGKPYTGAMEVKTGWRELTDKDDPSRYFTRTVITYRQKGDSIQYINKTYALIGIHIIHKTRNYPAFVFATFEHVDDSISHMGYIELDSVNSKTGPLVKNFPRLHPISDRVQASTEYAHQLLLQKNPKSIWQYYRLIGVQGHPTNDSTSFSYFLANYVIESDPTLADFRGSGIGNPHDGGVNTMYQGQKVTMGGCQGCHGVAQQKLGGDFSFLMDNIGKPVDTPDIGLDSHVKLQRYLKAFRDIRIRNEARSVK